MSKKLIPFSWYPYTWGVKGKTREIYLAEFTLSGYELAVKLHQINKDSFNEDDYKKKLWEIELKYGKITEPVYHRRLVELIKDEKQRALATLELDYKENKISETEYSKQLATLNGEPWVTVMSMDFGGNKSLEGSFELDWNDKFVDKLVTEGYLGPTPDNIVNQWFMEVCRNVAMEEFDGTGDFTADSEANLDAVKRWGADTKSFGEGRKGYK